MTTQQERGQKTKERMLRTAFDLFHQKGVNATSVDEVLEKSGTGKSQFYYYFKSKEGLVHETIQDFFARLKSREIPVQYELKTWDDLECWFRFFIEGQKQGNCERGCPLATIAYELTDSNELIRQDINLIFEYIRNALARLFLNLKAQGELVDTADPDQLADFCVAIMQGGLLTAKIRKDSAPFQNSVQHALIYLKSLRPNPSKK
ncbi:MAG: TetR/AcrR family transcriptional regulator [Candidatus Omnitrophica bacterium]|nr:TetR/AcrR family transcriptional regulator [Candidatus Omnitrophota bacterium]